VTAWRSVPLIVLLAVPPPHAFAQGQDDYQRIEAAIDRGDLAAAKQAADAALSKAPDDARLHNLAGSIAAQQGDMPRAEAHFREAIRLVPRATPPYENLARLYQEHTAEDPDAARKALETYRALLAIDPGTADGLFQAALLEATAGQFTTSLALLDRLPREVQERAQVAALRVADLASSGDPGARTAAEALAAHPEVVAEDVLVVLPAFAPGKSDEVLARLLVALDGRGIGRPEFLRRLADIQVRRGELVAARATLERLGGENPPVPVLLELARVADKAGDHKGALGYLAHARSLEPANATVHFLFGIACIELDLVAEAYESLKKAVELQPENAVINYMMGAVSLHRHEPSEAIPFFEKYVGLQPDDPRGRFALGVAYFHSSDFESARRELTTVADRPETAAGAHYFLARIARQSNQLDDARQHVTRSIEANDSFADAWAELGLIQTRSAQYGDAERSLQKALALDPENYQATVNLTTLYTRTRDPRRDEQAARLEALQKKRGERAQEFLRQIEVVPPSR
jgi:tetratricopeptide (TPR) repeat protein